MAGERLKERNAKWVLSNDDANYFDVPGAGKICISGTAHNRTGNVVGFSFGVEWGAYGFNGGVLSRSEAKKMAEFILSKCNEISISEEDEIKEREGVISGFTYSATNKMKSEK